MICQCGAELRLLDAGLHTGLWECTEGHTFVWDIAALPRRWDGATCPPPSVEYELGVAKNLTTTHEVGKVDP